MQTESEQLLHLHHLHRLLAYAIASCSGWRFELSKNPNALSLHHDLLVFIMLYNHIYIYTYIMYILCIYYVYIMYILCIYYVIICVCTKLDRGAKIH